MTSRMTLTLAALAAALVLPAGASAATCASAGSTTKLANASGRIFTKPHGSDVRWYACSSHYHHKWMLADAVNRGDGGISISLPTLIPGYAGVVVYDIDSAGEGDWSIKVISTRTGATRVARSAQGASTTFHEPSEFKVSDLALTGVGWPAWIDDVPGAVDEVQAYDSTGARLLATGAIDLTSLTASGQQVSWTAGGSGASATLG